MMKNFFTDNFVVRDSDIEYVKDNIVDINLKMNTFAIILGLTSFICVGIYSLFNNFIHSRTSGYFLSAFILCCLLYAKNIPFKDKYKKTVILTFVTSCILTFLGLWMSYITPDRRSVAFYIIIILESLLFINKPRYNTLFILGADIVFIVTMGSIKVGGIYEFDVFSIFLYSLIGIAFEHIFVKSRLVSLINAKNMEKMSYCDMLTNTRNRNSYEERIKGIKSSASFVGTVLYFDVDGLHNINNIKGHDEGDRVLIKVASILNELFNKNDVYRTGGDEFIVISSESKDDAIQDKVNYIRSFLKESKFKFSIGYACSNGDKSFDEVKSLAENLMYSNKSNNYVKKYRNEVLRSKEYALTNLSFDDIARSYSLLYNTTRDYIYIYIYDLDTDIIKMSDLAVKKFNMNTSRVSFTERLDELVYPEDYELIKKEMKDLFVGKKTIHNLRYRWLDRKGVPHWIVCQGKVVESDDKKARFLVGSMAEIDNTPLADNLTGFLNVDAQMEFINNAIKRDKFYFLLIGIDNLRIFNKHYGYEIGDSVIQFVANVVKEKLKPGQEVVKMYSDQFLIIDSTSDSHMEAIELYNEIRKEINKQNFFKNEDFITISAGVLNSGLRLDNFNEYMKRVSCTFLEAKRQGKNRILIFSDEQYAKIFKKESLLALLKKSIINNFEGFSLVFQPIMKEPESKIKGVEALLRFECDGVKYSPIEFIPILEESDLICDVGIFIVSKSVELLKSTNENITVSLNASYKQLMSEDVVNEFIDVVTKEGMQERVIVELTESGYISKDTYSAKAINRLIEEGIKISIDDFGTGYSNFYNIIKWKPSFIKIDRMFVKNCDADEHKKDILIRMIELGHYMNSQIVCEGVETDTELTVVKNAKADYVQGYYYSKPLTKDELLEKYNIK
ncbi:bifunctional diguanylate cyclase/phosphodiesterase [Faecalibacillus intestinalis]